MTVIVGEFLSNPIAFCGGFVSGILRLDLHQEPLRSWLEQQGVYPTPPSGTVTDSGKPKTIAID
ncbi:MAG: hypothetical protein OHK0012_00940 [Synechococcales cyanobacterium]